MQWWIFLLILLIISFSCNLYEPKVQSSDFSKYPESFFPLSALKHVSEKKACFSPNKEGVEGFFVPNFNQFGSDNIPKLQKGYQFDFEFLFSSLLRVTPNPN